MNPAGIDLDRALIGFQAGIARREDRSGERYERIARESRADFVAERIAKLRSELWSGEPDGGVSKLRARPRLDPLPFNAPDHEIRRVAGEAAEWCERARNDSVDEFEALARLRNVANGMGIDPPKCRECAPIPPQLERLCSARWWRRKLRVQAARRNEAAGIEAGKVHRRSECYVTDAGVDRRRASQKRNDDVLRMLTAVNENGEAFSLADLAERSTANPELRRNELMTRIKGLEQIAEQRGDSCLFVTITLASRWHAADSKTGKRNPKYQGGKPREAQAELQGQWARARASLAKAGVRVYGLRVVEPHHDGTPHWHMLVFCDGEHRKPVIATMRGYALEDSPDEPGAKKHRFTVKRVYQHKGGAVAYVAKYLAKNVDGHQLELATEYGADGETRFTGDAATVAERIRAWSSHWGIRQFQFFGSPPVTWYRELRRVREPVALPIIEAARAPADAGDYAGHVRAAGGVLCSKRNSPLATFRDYATDASGNPAATMYGDEPKPVVRGVAELSDTLAVSIGWRLRKCIRKGSVAVRASRVRLINWIESAASHLRTRVHSWTLLYMREGAAKAPRTRVNNCNQPEGANDGARASRNDDACLRHPSERAQGQEFTALCDVSQLRPSEIQPSGWSGFHSEQHAAE